VTQTSTAGGVGNTAFISQSNKNNEAYQTQEGNDNSATIWQDQIAGPPAALNGGDKAWQTQKGKHNTATIDQGTSGNELPLPTPLGAFTLAELADLPATVPISPNGSNEATQTQNGDYSVAYTSQGGTGNKSWQTQNSTALSDADKDTSRHFQYGNSNEATTLQTGIKNTENTLQIGNSNISNVIQNNSAGTNANVQVGFSFGNSNHINVTQTGL